MVERCCAVAAEEYELKGFDQIISAAPRFDFVDWRWRMADGFY
jgi:hypothetical protein